MLTCTDCQRHINEETDHYITCNTCGAASCAGCDCHCICDDIAPNRVGNGAFGALLRESLRANGMSFDDFCFLMGKPTTGVQ